MESEYKYILLFIIFCFILSVLLFNYVLLMFIFVQEGRKEMFCLTSDIWLMTILIVRKETRCRHIGYSVRLTARVLLYAPSHRQYSTYHGLCYTSRGALAGTRQWVHPMKDRSDDPSHHERTLLPRYLCMNAKIHAKSINQLGFNAHIQRELF